MEKTYLLQIRMDFPDGTNHDRTIGYTSKEKAINAWRKEVNEYRRNYEEDIVLDNIKEGKAIMNRQGVNANIWVEELKMEE